MVSAGAKKKNDDLLPALLQKWQEAGAAYARAHGMPTLRWEKWKYTSLKHLEKTEFAPGRHEAETLKKLPPSQVALEEACGEIALVDGVLRPDLSRLPHHMTIDALADIAAREPDFLARHIGEEGFEDDQIMLAFNAAHVRDGVVVRIAAKTRVTQPLIIRHYTTGTTSVQSRVVIVAEDSVEATILEVCEGAGDTLNNNGVHVHVGQNAKLHHYRWQNESPETTHLTTSTVTVGRDASYDSFVLTTGAKMARQDITAHMIGENAECRLNGVYLLGDKQHGDTTILVHHKQPHGRSNQTFKGIIDDHARAVFQGKVFVHRGAQKTDGYQLNNALLLSKTAEVDVKPELEIYADDVKCSHGATTGQIDTAPLFYLRTRGLSEAQARLLIMRAFLGPALDEIRDETIRETLSEAAFNWLQQRTGAL